ncbi:hypothetical protein SAMD00019534_049690 [Acytostelium subglobosum LB1]|uniref:hypothetical protein n=1 Tax=Acytostelium subglobosum LB1 TaxID=1410327 RepID=UPI000644EDE8|nr:hypothetical protein SAMD00019534_049690 [Acytostelium subglobosum LB1]GAM21794.1 hypothetical protein SAMD00019534_049690 [Acytostelium subglobosum LB1]|eukprot:XP_012754894.1 hypothetical protein SAMD00019534_049690 [Acytostelium subglobosum LB1]
MTTNINIPASFQEQHLQPVILTPSQYNKLANDVTLLEQHILPDYIHPEHTELHALGQEPTVQQKQLAFLLKEQYYRWSKVGEFVVGLATGQAQPRKQLTLDVLKITMSNLTQLNEYRKNIQLGTTNLLTYIAQERSESLQEEHRVSEINMLEAAEEERKEGLSDANTQKQRKINELNYRNPERIDPEDQIDVLRETHADEREELKEKLQIMNEIYGEDPYRWQESFNQLSTRHNREMADLKREYRGIVGYSDELQTITTEYEEEREAVRAAYEQKKKNITNKRLKTLQKTIDQYNAEVKELTDASKPKVVEVVVEKKVYVDKPVVVEKIVYVNKPVDKIVEKVVEKIVYLEKPTDLPPLVPTATHPMFLPSNPKTTSTTTTTTSTTTTASSASTKASVIAPAPIPAPPPAPIKTDKPAKSGGVEMVVGETYDALEKIRIKREMISVELAQVVANLKTSHVGKTTKEIDQMPLELQAPLRAALKAEKKLYNRKKVLSSKMAVLNEREKIMRFYYTRQDVPLLLAPSSESKSALTMASHKLMEDLRVKDDRGLAMIGNIRNLLIKHFRGYRIDVHLFGSSANGLAFVNSDLDISFLTDKPVDQVRTTHKISSILKQNNYVDILPITRTRVPIVRFRDEKTNLSCDLSINNPLAIHNSRMIYDYCQIDNRVRPMAFVIKKWSKVRCINDASKNTLHSYSYANMLIHFLQREKIKLLPCLQQMANGFVQISNGKKYGNGQIMQDQMVDGHNVKYYKNIDSLMLFGNHNRSSVGDLLFEFFKYYAVEFDYRQTISIRTGTLLENKQWEDDRREYYLNIEDPFDVTFNIARSIRKPHHLAAIVQEFHRAYQLLSNNGTISDLLKEKEQPSSGDQPKVKKEPKSAVL